MHAAIGTGLPIVPVVIHNAATLWPRNELRFRTGDLHIRGLESVDTSGWGPDTVDDHVQQIRKGFVQALGEEE